MRPFRLDEGFLLGAINTHSYCDRIACAIFHSLANITFSTYFVYNPIIIKLVGGVLLCIIDEPRSIEEIRFSSSV